MFVEVEDESEEKVDENNQMVDAILGLQAVNE